MGPVNKVSHVFTLGHVAEMLGEDEEWLFEVAEEMDPEDGQLWVVGVGEDGVMAFTDDGIENLKELIAIHKEDPHHRKTPPRARCDDQAEKRRVRRGLTINWTDQRTRGLPRMVTTDKTLQWDMMLGKAMVKWAHVLIKRKRSAAALLIGA